MDWLWYLCAGLFLPLYPLSVIPNAMLSRLTAPSAKAVLLPVWALLGVGLLAQSDSRIPMELAWWGGLTALLYAVRLLTVRDIGAWAGFALSSALALLWLVGAAEAAPDTRLLAIYALSFAVPLSILLLLSGTLIQRFGAAYAGLYRGLGASMPRYATLLVITLLAVVATPVFPSFAALFAAAHRVAPWPVLMLLLNWLLWTWAAVNLLREIVFGRPYDEAPPTDIAAAPAAVYAMVLVLWFAAGVYLMGNAL